jgi:hypothetical protein
MRADVPTPAAAVTLTEAEHDHLWAAVAAIPMVPREVNAAVERIVAARAQQAEAERDDVGLDLVRALARAEAKVARVEALFAGGPDTPCRTTWREDWPLAGPTECVEVPMDDLRAALDGP